MSNVNHVSQTLLLTQRGAAGEVLTRVGTDEVAFAAAAPVVGPTLLTGQSMWFEADVGIGVADGAPIPTWADQSGNALNITAAAAVRPVFRAQDVSDGLPFVEFDGVQQALLRTGMPAVANTAMTHYLVWRSVDATAAVGAYSLNIATGFDHTQAGSVGMTFSGGVSQVGRNSVLYEYPFFVSAGTGAVRTGPFWNVCAMRWYVLHGKAYLGLWHNGNEAAFDLGGAALTAFNFTVASVGSRFYGAGAGALASFCKCDIRAYGWYPVQHTDAQVRQMLQYLSSKWAVATI